MDDSTIKKYSYREVWEHRSSDDLWVIYEGNVLDVTPFLKDHPGGTEVLLRFAGGDVMPVFGYVGHSKKAIEMTSKYVIGVVDLDSEPLPKETST